MFRSQPSAEHKDLPTGDQVLVPWAISPGLVGSSTKQALASDSVKVSSLLLQAEQVFVCNGAPGLSQSIVRLQNSGEATYFRQPMGQWALSCGLWSFGKSHYQMEEVFKPKSLPRGGVKGQSSSGSRLASVSLTHPHGMS